MTMAMGLCTGLQASVTEHQPPAPLPEFKTPEQLARWRAETTAKTANLESASSRPSTLDSSTPFYTGKPYLAESGSYAFKYREFNPKMGRWTTVDPSGFPDGANNRIYAAVPTTEFDDNGLYIKSELSGYSSLIQDDAGLWNLLEAGSLPLTSTAMRHAESGEKWINDDALNNAIMESQLFDPKVYSDVQSWLNSNVSSNGDLNVNMSAYGNNGGHGHYNFDLSDFDLKFALHGVSFAVTGYISGYGKGSSWTFDGTVSYSKNWTFTNHRADKNILWYNKLGLDLEDAGLIHAYSVSGSFFSNWYE